jgi:hypothetical protein
MAKKKRFEVVFKEGSMTSTKIYVDQETGVNYLFISEGYGGALTVLLDREGKPVITSVTKQYE